jgi:Sigma-70, region 4
VTGLRSYTSAAVVAGLVNDELRGWLELVPHGILRLAASRLSTAERSAICETEWLPELSYILKAAGERPVTRLVLGTKFSIGILLASRRIERSLDGGALQRATAALLETLPPLEAGVLSMRFGLADSEPGTLGEIADPYGVSRYRIRQVQQKAISKARHPGRMDLMAQIAELAGDSPLVMAVQPWLKDDL